MRFRKVGCYFGFCIQFQYKQGSHLHPPPTPPKMLETPAGCLTIQINSNTLYPEVAWDSTGKVLSPTRLSSFRLRCQM